MSSKPEIRKKAEEALLSLNGIVRAEPRPFFYARLMARIKNEHKSVWERVSVLIARPAVAILSLFAVLILNVFVLVGMQRESAEYSVSAVADEYRNTTAYYDIDNIQP